MPERHHPKMHLEMQNQTIFRQAQRYALNYAAGPDELTPDCLIDI